MAPSGPGSAEERADGAAKTEPTAAENCRKVTSTFSAVLVGFIRMCFCLPVILLLILNVYKPAVTYGVSQSKLSEPAVQVVTTIWAYCRLILEVLASFILFGDSVVTFIDLTEGTGGWYSFISMFELPHWMLRFLLAVVIGSSISCNAYEFISQTWTEELALVYAGLPVVVLFCGILALFLWKIPIIKHLSWFAPANRKEHKDKWTPNVLKNTTDKRLTGERDGNSSATCELVQICFTLFIPIFCFSLNLMGIIKVATGDTQSCCYWRTLCNYSLHLLLNIITSSYFITRYVRKMKERVFFLAKWTLGYLIASVLSDLHGHVSEIIPYIIVQVFGLILLICIPLLVTPFSCDSRAYCKTRKEWIVEFFQNFTQFSKWYRLVTAVAYIVAMAGALMALLSIPLPWFSVKWEADTLLQGIFDITESFQESIEKAIAELQAVFDFGDAFAGLSCPAFISAMVAAIGLGAVPAAGPVASKAAVTTLRTAKFFKKVGDKALKYKKEFKRMKDLVGNLTKIADAVKKPLVVATTVDNYGLIMFLMPVILTGIIALFLAFWPRKDKVTSQLKKKKKDAITFGASLMLFVFNMVGMFLFQVWAPFITSMADAVPLVTATYEKGPGWIWVESGFVCAILSSSVFLVQSIMVLVRSSGKFCHVPCGGDAADEESDGDMNVGYDVQDSTTTTNGGRTKRTRVVQMKKWTTEGAQSLAKTTLDKLSTKPSSFINLGVGAIKPEGWVLSLLLITIAASLSVVSVFMEWITFDPILQPKWAKIIGKFEAASSAAKVVHGDVEDDSGHCDLFPVNLKGLMPTFLSLEFMNLWNNIILKFQLPQFDLIDLNYDFRFGTTQLFNLVFAIPNLACFGLVIAGLVASFSRKASMYFSSEEATQWISKITLYNVFVVINMVITVIKMLQSQRIPLFNLNVNIELGFILWMIAQILTFMVWILLHMEQLAPVDFEVRDPSSMGPRTEVVREEVQYRSIHYESRFVGVGTNGNPRL